MEWLFILGLGGWVFWQSRKIGTLERRLNELERAPKTPVAATAPPRPIAPPWLTPTAPQPVETPPPQPPANETDDVLVLDQPLPPEEQEPLVLDTPLPPDEREPLLLDTPLPPVSNDQNGAAPTGPIPPPLPERPRTAPQPAVATAPRKQRRAGGGSLLDWLAQQGLAWLGGAAMVFVAITAVTLATHPLARLACGIGFGLLLLVASEFARRAGKRKPPGHPLVAALLAGAGAATFYITTWAAHGIYDLISWEATAGLLLVCALILYGLSQLHGQALGALAVIAAMIAPPLASGDAWPSPALTLYVCLVGLAGFALAWFRRWAWVAAVTLVGFYFWFAAAIAADEVRRALALLSFASIGGVAAFFRKPIEEEPKARLTWTMTQAILPAIALCVSSVLLMGAWLSLAPALDSMIAGPALIGVFLVALAALAVRTRASHPSALVVAITFLVLGFVAYLRARFHYAPLGFDFYPTVLAASLVVAIAALGARAHREARGMVAGAGAVGAALLAMLAASSRENWHDLTAWGALFSVAAVLLACAVRAERDAQKPNADAAVDFWCGAAAALVLLGVESAFPPEIRTAAHAGAALLFAIGFSWKSWRAFRFASLTAAVFSIGHSMSPTLIGAALSNAIPIWGALLVLAITAGLIYAAAHFAQRGGARTTAEALGSAAVIVLIVGAYLALRWFAEGGAGSRLDSFAETALRALALMAAGFVLLPRPGGDVGIIARWRGHVLMGLGLLMTLLLPVLIQNPWLGGLMRADVIGPPVLNTLLLAYAAPAALALFAASRLYDFQRLPARVYAASGGLLALVWALLEIRRLFHGADMASGPVGLLEGACYAITFLTSALAVSLVGRARLAKHGDGPFTHDLVLITRACAWSGIIVSGTMFLLSHHPAWGTHDATRTDALATGLATLMQLAAMVVALYLGRALSRSREPLSTRFAAACLAALLAWSFGHAAIRWLHQGGAMDGATPLVGLEGFAHALWPLVLVLGAAELTARAPGRDTVRAYLHDLQAIWAAAVWPALVFTALGLWAVFNPWWGIVPVQASGIFSSILVLGALLLGAGLSALAPRVPRVQAPTWLAYTARVACVAHLFVAATLAVRFVFHGSAFAGAVPEGLEMWALSAVWAVFGGGVLTLGGARNDPVLRWCGLAIVFVTAGKVVMFDTAQLSGWIRLGSFVVLGAVAFIAAWLAGRQAARRPDDLITPTPNGGRGTARDRRQNST